MRSARIILWLTLLTVALSSAAVWRPWRSNQEDSDLPFWLRDLDAEVWGPELKAQRYWQGFFVPLWDRLIAADDKLGVLSDVSLQRLRLGKPVDRRETPLGITTFTLQGDGPVLGPEAWKGRLARYRDAGYRIVHTDWHHENFRPAHGGHPPRSEVSFEVHVRRDGGDERPQTRLRISGLLTVRWERSSATPRSVVASRVRIARRDGPPLFTEQKAVDLKKNTPVGGLAVHDLDHDGYPSLLLGGKNLLLRNEGGHRFTAERLFPGWPVDFSALVVADFTGDGTPDAVGTDSGHRPRLYPGDGEGGFGLPRIIRATGPLVGKPWALTAGDVNGDGALDLFIGQWRLVYWAGAGDQGKWPHRYFDATDGHPNYLLQNRGGGHFTDVTDRAGFGAKARRRTLSASLLDLDGDHDADLVQVSDFAGVDIFRNDGDGRFTDVTDAWLDNRHLFGMSHTFGDYNRDGRLDLYTVGMSLPTVRRLERMGVGRWGTDAPHTAMRMAMTYGNRLYLRKGDRFVQPPFADQVARSNWSWGSTTLDFDNDRAADIFVATGNITGETTADYNARFWCRDIYRKHLTAHTTTARVLKRVGNGKLSYSGRIPNRLFVNQNGEGFRRLGYVVGLGRDFDARNVVSADLDRDGYQDLIVGSVSEGGTLHLLRNAGRAGTDHHWIGLDLRRSASGISPVGTKVTLRDAKGERVRRLVTGDSYKSQHPFTVHFGLGELSEVEAIKITWPDGRRRTLTRPAVDRYHTVRTPD